MRKRLRTMKKPQDVSLLLLSFYVFFRAQAGEVTQGPQSQTVHLGSGSSEFRCQSVGSAPYWIISGVNLEARLQRQYREERGIRITSHRLVGGTYISTLEVNAMAANNNTEIQCAVFSGDDISQPALLQIQGILDGPSDLIISALNLSVIHLTWSSPFTLNITESSGPAVLGYRVLIKNRITNESSGILLDVNSTLNEYNYTLEENECRWTACEACVAGINGAGVGLFGRPVTLVPAFVSLRGPNFLNLNSAGQFACATFCSAEISLLVAWFINGTVYRNRTLTAGPVATRISHSCLTGEGSMPDILDVIPQSLHSFTLQCAAIYLPDKDELSSDWSARVYYSQEVLVEVDDEAVTVVERTTAEYETTTAEIELEYETTTTEIVLPPTKTHTIELTVGVAAGITLMFCTLLILLLAIFLCWARKRNGSIIHNTGIVLSASCDATVAKPSGGEVIYEQCGDPLSNVLVDSHGPGVVTYETVLPPSPPTHRETLKTQPCVAYGTTYTGPVTEPCVAYSSHSHT